MPANFNGEDNMVKAQFYYFKSSGKYYTQGEGVVPPTNETWSRDQILALNGGRMPGLSSTGVDFQVVIIPDETAETGWPQLKAAIE